MATQFASGTATGSASVSASAALAQLLSGTTFGSGILSIPPLLASGSALGGSTVTGDALLTINVSGLSQGQGTLVLVGVPDTVYGTSVMTGELVTEVMPPPVCTCRTPVAVTPTSCSCGGTLPAIPCSCSTGKGPFRWAEFYQPTDLRLFLRDSFGAAMPNAVSYTLFWLRNGFPVQAGPANRTPVMARLGEFYVVGKVGEFGQPGEWLVRWQYQRNFFSPIYEVESHFTVQDAVAAADQRDTTQRILKYGWN